MPTKGRGTQISRPCALGSVNYSEMKKLRPRKKPELIEGEQAFVNLQNAVRAVLKVPKDSIPPPFGKKAKGKKSAKDESAL